MKTLEILGEGIWGTPWALVSGIGRPLLGKG